ncbi:MAG: hypothetical protein ABR94_07655 [Sphingobacteriales bacterium BACL12 MAG-120802-bin5]|jgi:hypothetical protein|nr:MAG: hypothetical protein ABR94_07655 [Sphingobacteriales bacterium BACL12 MAG-120802-bin5]
MLNFIRVRRSNEQDIGEVLKDFFKAFKIDGKVNEIRIKEVWEEVMGKTMARYTSDVRLHNGQLKVFINSAPLKHELTYNKDVIIQRINEAFGEEIVNKLIIH